MSRFRPRLIKATFFLTAVISACANPGSPRAADPQLSTLDPARGVQLDIDPGAPMIRCAFTPVGGPRRVLLYEVEPPVALWRYFAQPRWKLIGDCEPKGGKQAVQPVFSSAPRPPQVAARVWLVTAWDSVSHGEWTQMERYTARVTGAKHSFFFGHPEAGGSPADLVTVTAEWAPPGSVPAK